jgi:hypothetical protein
MLKGEGLIRIDGLAVGEVSVNLLSPDIHMAVKYAFVNSLTAERFGSGNRNTDWSSETIQKLAELIQAIEQDLVRTMFSGGAPAVEEAPPTTDSVGEQTSPNQSDEDGVPGL